MHNILNTVKTVNCTFSMGCIPVWYTKQLGFIIWLLLICEFAYSPRCICYHRINACSACGHLQTWTVLGKIWVIRWTCCQLRSNTVMLCLLVSACIPLTVSFQNVHWVQSFLHFCAFFVIVLFKTPLKHCAQVLTSVFSIKRLWWALWRKYIY